MEPLTWLLLAIIAWILIVVFDKLQSYYFYKKIEKKNKTDKNSIDTDLANLVLQDNFVNKVNMLIDSIIKEHSDMYQIMILSINESKAQYISSEEQDNMEKYVTHMTIKNLSPELRKIIGLVYDINDPKDLRSVISNRVKLYLINFIIEYNADITE